jgi:hypothetical protein
VTEPHDKEVSELDAEIASRLRGRVVPKFSLL